MNERALRFEVTGCAEFQLGSRNVQQASNPRIFQDPAALEVLTQIRGALVQRRGYKLSHPQRAKGIEAGLAWKPISGVSISVMVGVSKRDSESVHFELISDLFIALWRRLPGLNLDNGEVKELWAKLIRDIDATLREDLSVECLRWYCVEAHASNAGDGGD